ncbi:TadE family protein [Microbacterium invictum]|uniref:Flp pilus assembly protein TadG n=1 Tax=Microbacterium invictum TaxID=515415 RepID=A0AA40VKV6_9MICO|nr:TadE family protein [Microbacterium invictum]MBB4138826.1 Flp pilus assembly protein TadG [Microbacterium invictum]
MRRSRHSDETAADAESERGSAALEFIVGGVILLVPIVYLIVALGAIQSSALGVDAGARHVARTIASAPDRATADARADLVLAAVADEYGLDPGRVDVTVTCRPAGAECPAAGATVVVHLAASVPLPLVPPILGLDDMARIPVEAVAVQKVSRFWGTQ